MKLINFNPKLHLKDCLNQIYSNPKYPLQKLEKGLSITKFIPESLCYPFIPIKSQVTGFKKQYNCLVQTYTLLRIIDNLVDRDFKDKNENILFLDKEALNIAKEDILKWELNPQNPFNPLFENMFNSSNYLSLEHKEKFKESLIYYFNSFEFDLKRFGIRETFDSKTINNYYSNTGNGLGGLLGNIFERSEKDIEFSTLISKYFEISKGLLSTKEDTKKGFVNLSKERLQKLNITLEDLLHPSVEVTQKLLEQSKIEIQKISKLEKIANNPFQKIVANWYLRY